MYKPKKNPACYDCCVPVIKAVNIPIELYESETGAYFIGYADGLTFTADTSIYARLYNPHDSGVILYVNVWTVTDLSVSPFRAQFWFNADPPGTPQPFDGVTTTNLAIRPTPEPRVIMQTGSNVSGSPSGGIRAFSRRGEAGATMVETENGKLIFPPGGSFLVFVTPTQAFTGEASGRIAFGWWEKAIGTPCMKTQSVKR